MAASKKRHLGEKTVNNFQSDLSSEDELLAALSSITIDSSDEELPAERHWQSGRFTPVLPEFRGEPGIRNTILVGRKTPFDYFQLFFDENMMQHIVDETNRYYSQNPAGERQHMSNWHDVTSMEIHTFLAITMLTGLINKNRIQDYWSTDPLLSTPIFSQYFTRNRYQDILHYLHFGNNEDISDNNNPLAKIKPIIDGLKKNFSSCVNPTQNLCIDESLMLWKGRLAFKQYIPSKRHRFGIKSFELVDCETKFVLDFIVYTGSNTECQITSELGLSGSIVLEMMRPYLNKGHHLYVDNWYTSPTLFELLHRNKTGACGTVRKNRKGLPPLTIKLKRGESQYSHTNILLALKWQDKREVHMLSTIHSTAYANSDKVDHQTGEEIEKPVCILDYTKNMGGVDHVDMQMSFSECIRKSVKWYKKVFFHLLDMAVYNAFVVYKLQNDLSPHLSDFRLDLIREILTQFGSQRSTTIGRPPARPPSLRLTARHFPALIPQTTQLEQPRRRCVVCSSHDLRRVTQYMCPDCDAPLCIVDCFKDYHTKTNY